MTSIVMTDVEAHVKWFNEKTNFGFFEVDIFGDVKDVFIHRSKLGTFQPYEMQEGAPAIISAETSHEGKWQVTAIHSICLAYVKMQGDTFVLPAPAREVAEPVATVAATLVVGETVRGMIHKVDPKKFSFLKVEGVSKLVFAHHSELPMGTKPTVGQIYAFTVGENSRGFVANRLQLIEAEASTDDVTVQAKQPVSADESKPMRRVRARKQPPPSTVLEDTSVASAATAIAVVMSAEGETMMGAALVNAGIAA